MMSDQLHLLSLSPILLVQIQAVTPEEYPRLDSAIEGAITVPWCRWNEHVSLFLPLVKVVGRATMLDVRCAENV